MNYRQSERNASSILEAAQQTAGMSISIIAAWIGPALAAAWFWSGCFQGRLSNDSFLLWVNRVAHYGGWTANWAPEAHQWLAARAELFWPLIVIAAFTSSPGLFRPVSVVTWAALLSATSLQPLSQVVSGLLALTAGLFLTAYLVDKFLEVWGDPALTHRGSFDWSSWLWLTGPCLTVVSAPFLPILVFKEMVQAYRVPDDSIRHPGLDLATESSRLSDKPIVKNSTRELATFFAKTVLLASSEDQHEKEMAIRAMRAFQSGPTGAVRVPRTE